MSLQNVSSKFSSICLIKMSVISVLAVLSVLSVPFNHSTIPTFLHSYIPTFLNSYIPTFIDSYCQGGFCPVTARNISELIKVINLYSGSFSSTQAPLQQLVTSQEKFSHYNYSTWADKEKGGDKGVDQAPPRLGLPLPLALPWPPLLPPAS